MTVRHEWGTAGMMDRGASEASSFPFGRPIRRGFYTGVVQGTALHGRVSISQVPVVYTMEFEFRAVGYASRIPLAVLVEETPGHVMVTDRSVHRSGEGVTLDEACTDYVENLIHYYQTLRRNQGRLSNRMNRHWQLVKMLIKEV